MRTLDGGLVLAVHIVDDERVVAALETPPRLRRDLRTKSNGLGFRYGDCATTTLLCVGCLMVRLVSLFFDFVEVLFLADPVQILTREGSAVEAESGLGPGLW